MIWELFDPYLKPHIKINYTEVVQLNVKVKLLIFVGEKHPRT